MAKKRKKPKMEFRYYQMPAGSPILALLGQKWVQNYGNDVDYLHFHNYLEIGFCYEGDGFMAFGEAKMRFSGREFTVIPPNYAHTTNSDLGTVSKWEYLFIDVEGFMKKFLNNPVKAEKMIQRIYSLNHFFSLYRIVQKFFHETFHIYEKILPFTDRTQITVSRMSIIGWNHRKFSSRKPHFSLTKRHKSIPFVTETNLQIIMKMKIIHIISIILNPLLSQKSQDRTSGRHLIITEFHLRFFSLLCHTVTSFSVLYFHNMILPVFYIFFDIFVHFLIKTYKNTWQTTFYNLPGIPFPYLLLSIILWAGSE